MQVTVQVRPRVRPDLFLLCHPQLKGLRVTPRLPRRNVRQRREGAVAVAAALTVRAAVLLPATDRLRHERPHTLFLVRVDHATPELYHTSVHSTGDMDMGWEGDGWWGPTCVEYSVQYECV